MVVGLAALPRLRDFCVEFQLANPRPDLIHPPSVTRIILPALTEFEFKGSREYLEDLVSRIDAPQLDQINIPYLNQLVDFQLTQLPLFIDRSAGPKLSPFRYARVTFYNDLVNFRTYRHANLSSPDPHYATTNGLCRGIDWQVSQIALVISHFSTTLSDVVHLKLQVGYSIQSYRADDIEWLHLSTNSPPCRRCMLLTSSRGMFLLRWRTSLGRLLPKSCHPLT